jgi:lipooligosaccharide transport system permease protein
VWQRNRDVFLKTWKTNFMPPFLEPVLYLGAIGFGLGQFVELDGRYAGVPYRDFIAPGLVAAAMMNAAFYECMYGSYVRMYYQRTWDAIVATPVAMDDVLAGEVLWGATKSMLYAVPTLLVAGAFGLVAWPSALVAVPLSILAGLMFATLAIMFTAIAPSIDAFNFPVFLFAMPMFLFSGTFFPTEELPPALQTVAWFLPLTHVVSISRAATFGDLFQPEGLRALWQGTTWIVVVGALAYVVSVNLMKRRLVK